jgi:hypothetical protein
LNIIQTKYYLFIFLLTYHCSPKKIAPISDPSKSTANTSIPVHSSDAECNLLAQDLADETTPINLINKLNTTYGKYIKNLTHPKITPQTINKSWDKFNKIQFISYLFTYKNIPFCNSRVSLTIYNNKINISGTPPSKNLNLFKINEDLPHKNHLLNLLPKNLTEKTPIKLISSNPCWFIKQNYLIKALNNQLSINKHPYNIINNKNEILYISDKTLHLRDIKTRVYLQEYSEQTSQRVLVDVVIPDVSSGGSLCNRKFSIKESDTEENALETSSIFIYSTDDNLYKFEQASLFTHANLQANWTENIETAKKWYGPHIKILLDEETKSPWYNQQDFSLHINRQYLPSLHNLRTDGDVISHELNHHVIYKNIYLYDLAKNYESLLLHESLADALVALRTKNSCIAESICSNQDTCSKIDCLRDTKNDLKYYDGMYKNKNYHLQSQIISGLIWDLVEQDSESSFLEIANLTLATIRILSPNANTEEFISKLFVIDESIFNKTLCSKIKQTVTNKGYSMYTSEISC